MVKSKDIIDEFPQSSYHINSSLNFILEQIGHWNDRDLMRVEMEPEFQRAHVWTEKQQISYMEYLVRNPGDSKAKSITFNCSSWNCYLPKDNIVYLVDGLQRLTAIKRFLNNEIPIYGYYLKEFDSDLFIKRIYLDIYVYALPYKEMLKLYINMNAGGVLHTEEEIVKVRVLLEKEIEKEA